MTAQTQPGATYQAPSPGALGSTTPPAYAPASTDPFAAAAAAQGAASTANINQQTVANRSNQTNASGDTLTWSQDPTTGQWTQNVSYGAGGPSSTLQQGATGLAGQAVDSLSQPLDTSGMTGLFSLGGLTPGGFNQQAQDAIMSRLQPQMDTRRAALETQLANQGITRGSEAWTNAENQQGRDENDARMQGILGGFQQGNTEFGQALGLASGTQAQRAAQLGERQTLREQPLQDTLGLLSGAKVPQFGQYTTAGSATAPNYLGAQQSSYNAALDKMNLSADQRAGLENGLFSLGGSFLNSGLGQKTIGYIGDQIGGLFGF